MFRVVCVKNEGPDHWPESDIVKIGHTYHVIDCVYQEGIHCYELQEDLGNIYPSIQFRPIDEQFGERIASEIEEDINQEELVTK